MKTLSRLVLFLSLSSLLSCGGSRIPDQSTGHISAEDKEEENSTSLKQKEGIPKPLTDIPFLPKPKNMSAEEVYTIVVHKVPINELLFALARDANINIDIDEDINGTVTLNAIDQTLSQILDRLTANHNLYYESVGDIIKIHSDKAFIKIYPIDYLNISRNSASQINVASEISSTGQGAVSGDGSSSSQGNSNSNTALNNVSNNQFWSSLESNLRTILITLNSVNRTPLNTNSNNSNNATLNTSAITSSTTPQSTPQSTTADSSGEDTSAAPVTGNGSTVATNTNDVIVNKEAAIIAINANRKSHKIIQNYLDHILLSSKRQVMIEATIAEIQLGDNYQAGVDWSSVQTNVSGVTLNQNLLGDTLKTPPSFSLSATTNSLKNPLRVTLKALEEFGEVKVLSSPKIMVLNNQTALLKVVDNIVYFTLNVDIESATDSAPRLITYESLVHTVPIGFVMAVTAFVNDSDYITLNVRPTISRKIGDVVDPNPALAEADVISKIPVIQVREMESILKVHDGDTAVLGGLMQNEVSEKSSGIPLLSGIPMLGDFFSIKDKQYGKSELVIFIKPSVINVASLEEDLKQWKKYLPSDNDPNQKLPPVSNPWKAYLKPTDSAEQISNDSAAQGLE